VVPEGRERMAGYGSFVDAMNALESAVSQSDYVAGEGFTAADVYVGSHIGWGLMFGTIEKCPAFEQYWARISARPAAVRAKEIDDAQMAEQQKVAPAVRHLPPVANSRRPCEKAVEYEGDDKRSRSIGRASRSTSYTARPPGPYIIGRAAGANDGTSYDGDARH
jgi:hypothetical protein